MSDQNSEPNFQVDNAIANMQLRMTQFSNDCLMVFNDHVQQQYNAIEQSYWQVVDGNEDPQVCLQLIQQSHQAMMDKNFEFTQFLLEAQYVFSQVLERHKNTLSRLYGILYDLENPYAAESPEVQQLMHELRTDWACEYDKLTAKKDAEIIKLSERLSEDLGIMLLDDPGALVLSWEGDDGTMS